MAKPDKGGIPVREREAANSIAEGGGEKEVFDFVVVAGCWLPPFAEREMEAKSGLLTPGLVERDCDFRKAGKRNVREQKMWR